MVQQPLEHASFDKPDEVRGLTTGGLSWSTLPAASRSAGSPSSRAGGGRNTSSRWPVSLTGDSPGCKTIVGWRDLPGRHVSGRGACSRCGFAGISRR
jgi:hypothetical protein